MRFLFLFVVGALALAAPARSAPPPLDPDDPESVRRFLRSRSVPSAAEVKKMIEALGDVEFRIRQQAYRDLSDVSGAALPLLEEFHEKTEEPEIKKGLARVLANRKIVPDFGMGEFAIDLFKRGHRGLAAELVAAIPSAKNLTAADQMIAAARLSADAEDRAELVDLLGNDLPSVRSASARVLRGLGGDDLLGHLRPLLEDDNPSVQFAAAEAFAAASDPACIPALAKIAGCDDLHLRWRATDMLRQITSREIAIDPLAEPAGVELGKWAEAKGWKPPGDPKPIPLITGAEDFAGWKRAPDQLLYKPLVEHREGFMRFSETGYSVWGSPLRFQNYRLRVDWRLSGGEPNGNSGVSLAKFKGPSPTEFKGWQGGEVIEIEIKQGNSGAMIPHATKMHIGDKLFPGGVADRFNPQNEDAHGWNTLEIEERDGRLRVFVNGLLQNEATGVSGESTALGLRSEGYPIDFRNITLEPLPGANATPEPDPVPVEPKADEAK